MKPPRAPRPVAAEDDASLFLLLPVERRRAIAAEVLDGAARAIVGAHWSGTLGALVNALEAHPAWRHLRALPVAASLPAQGESKPVAAPAPTPARPRREAAPRAPVERAPVERAPVEKAAPANGASVHVQAAVAALAGRLGESDPRAVEELRDLVGRWGLAAADAAWAKTQEIEAAGGLVRDGRRKTPGGVFFYLLKSAAGRELLGPTFAQPPPRPAAPEPPARKPDGTVDALLALIAERPGLRADEIQAQLGAPKLMVRAALAALRAQRKVRVNGAGKLATYFLAPTSAS